MAMPLLPLSAVVGSQPGWAGAQAAGPALALASVGTGGLTAGGCSVAAGAQAAMTMLASTSAASKTYTFLLTAFSFFAYAVHRCNAEIPWKSTLARSVARHLLCLLGAERLSQLSCAYILHS